MARSLSPAILFPSLLFLQMAEIEAEHAAANNRKGSKKATAAQQQQQQQSASNGSTEAAAEQTQQAGAGGAAAAEQQQEGDSKTGSETVDAKDKLQVVLGMRSELGSTTVFSLEIVVLIPCTSLPRYAGPLVALLQPELRPC